MIKVHKFRQITDFSISPKLTANRCSFEARIGRCLGAEGP